MKQIVLAAGTLVCLAAAPAHRANTGAAPHRTASKKAFSFMGRSSDVTNLEPFDFFGTTCVPTASGPVSCEAPIGAARIAATRLVSASIAFNDGKLTRVAGVTVTGYFSDLAASFTTKYGAPSTSTKPKWQNQMGATFDNEVKIWAFADGLLELDARGNKVDEAQFTFSLLAKKDIAPINF